MTARRQPERPGHAALTPALALAYLRELSADLRAGVVLDAAGALLAGPAALAVPARALLAERPDAGAIVARGAAGAAFAARDGQRAVVVTTGPLALDALVLHDLERVLAALAPASAPVAERPGGPIEAAPTPSGGSVERDAAPVGDLADAAASSSGESVEGGATSAGDSADAAASSSGGPVEGAARSVGDPAAASFGGPVAGAARSAGGPAAAAATSSGEPVVAAATPAGAGPASRAVAQGSAAAAAALLAAT